MISQGVISKYISRFWLSFGVRRSLSSSAGNTYLAQCLNSRCLLRVHGDEVEDYIQGLITNDIKHLSGSVPSIYAMFLSNRGRVLYDTIIYKGNEEKTFFVECDATAAGDLRKHLLMYKVRRKISVDPVEDMKIWAVCNEKTFENPNCVTNEGSTSSIVKTCINKGCLMFCDPRSKSLGMRAVAPKDLVMSSDVTCEDIKVVQSNFYNILRYKLGVGEGVTELPQGQCFPLEANCDFLNGVSFSKGCYIGQELTARTYHTGVIRKRLMPIKFDESADFDSGSDAPIVSNNGAEEKQVGKLRGFEGEFGIGLLRIEEALKATLLRTQGKSLKTHCPFWWPNEVLKLFKQR